MELRAKITNGTIHFRNSHVVRTVLNRLEGKEAWVTFEEWSNRRSIQQNKYLHVVLGILAPELGYTPEELKTAVKKELGFVYYKPDLRKDLNITVYKSTAKMTKEEISSMIDYVVKLAAEHGVIIPTPEEYYEGIETQYNR